MKAAQSRNKIKKCRVVHVEVHLVPDFVQIVLQAYINYRTNMASEMQRVLIHNYDAPKNINRQGHSRRWGGELHFFSCTPAVAQEHTMKPSTTTTVKQCMTLRVKIVRRILQEQEYQLGTAQKGVDGVLSARDAMG